MGIRHRRAVCVAVELPDGARAVRCRQSCHACLAWLLAWAIRLGRAGCDLSGWVLALSVFATASICTTFGLGQYGVLVLAALAGTALLAERGNWLLAGLLFAAALTKVTLAAPFAVALVFSKYIKTWRRRVSSRTGLY
jgi:hypothetical protein